jgi:hypothetical protein
MGASSVTGKGPGDAECVKGPGNKRNFYVPQVTTHVVAAGEGAVVGAGGTVVIPLPASLTGAESCYSILITRRQAALQTDLWVSAKTDDADGSFVSFTVSGTAGHLFDWAVLRVYGFGNDFIDPECSVCADAD